MTSKLNKKQTQVVRECMERTASLAATAVQMSQSIERTMQQPTEMDMRRAYVAANGAIQLAGNCLQLLHHLGAVLLNDPDYMPGDAAMKPPADTKEGATNV